MDGDNDGIQDQSDKCPTQPETWNRFADHDGCPDDKVEQDSDYDGILDSVDQCLLERERYNGFEDDDGCPDIPAYLTDTDSDFDGIPNSLDQCPMIPETYNKFQDDDGCQDSVIDAKSRADSDGDGLYDLVDHCAQMTIFLQQTVIEMDYQML
jgi:hypothetical protein